MKSGFPTRPVLRVDGLVRRRLDRPYIRRDGQLREADWREALDLVADRLKGVPGERIAAIAGDLCDAESMFALKESADRAWSNEPRVSPRRSQARSALPRRVPVQHDDRRHRESRRLSARRHQPALGSAAGQRTAAQALSPGGFPGRRDRSGPRSDLSGRDAGRGRRDAERAGARRPSLGGTAARCEESDDRARAGSARPARRRASAGDGPRRSRKAAASAARIGTGSTCCIARRRGSAGSISALCRDRAGATSAAFSPGANRATSRFSTCSAPTRSTPAISAGAS